MNDTLTLTSREDQIRLGLWMFLATVTMLFAAFASAYIVRRSGSDWQSVALPSIVWINTAVLAASSAALEIANRRGDRRRWRSALAACLMAIGLGLVFLAGQLAAWRSMAASGVYLPSNPHASFFFMLTGAHLVHVAAALAVLVWGTGHTWRGHRNPRRWAASMELCRTFWHYLGALWAGLLVMMTVY
jgi:cytochrome c oxidase subunit 3